jgi:aquaporin Z
MLVSALVGGTFRAPPVSWIVTAPGPAGTLAAFAAEATLAFVLMLVVLITANRRSLMRFTGLAAAALVTAFITFEAPLSGMSINPARTIASALPSGSWMAAWIYLTAPPLGMLLAAEAYLRLARRPAVYCAKLNHQTTRRCIFNCRHGEVAQAADPRAQCAPTAAVPAAVGE